MAQPSHVFEGKFSALGSKVETGDCVLVLGPRIVVPGEISGGAAVSIDEFLSRALLDDLGAAPGGETAGLRATVARYERERNAAECRSVIQGAVEGFCDHTTELHRNLASLPFRLVLSATPDRMMYNALLAAGKPSAREAAYDYCRGLATQAPLALPSTDAPIVYSLFGRFDRPESMVLTDKNLLDYLVGITRESPALPDPVRATLRAPSTVFLFMGFGFTNWWLRLLLKVLEVTGVENRALSLALEDAASFSAAAVGDNNTFFRSVGIHIESKDWNALARSLAAEYRERAPRPTAHEVFAAQRGPTEAGRAPLVFLSYASDDRDRVDELRVALQERGIAVWQDHQNLRGGQNWEDRITRLIRDVDYFVFVQTGHMDQRDQERRDGVYNRELKLALDRLRDQPYGSVFVVHVTIGGCRPRPEPELAKIHRIAIDTPEGLDALVQAIRASFEETAAGQGGGVAARSL